MVLSHLYYYRGLEVEQLCHNTMCIICIDKQLSPSIPKLHLQSDMARNEATDEVCCDHLQDE